MNEKETVHARQVRAAKANDRNALIAFVLGLALIAWWFIAGVVSGKSTGGIIALLGVLLVVLGIVFRGRRPRR